MHVLSGSAAGVVVRALVDEGTPTAGGRQPITAAATELSSSQPGVGEQPHFTLLDLGSIAADGPPISRRRSSFPSPLVIPAARPHFQSSAVGRVPPRSGRSRRMRREPRQPCPRSSQGSALSVVSALPQFTFAARQALECVTASRPSSHRRQPLGSRDPLTGVDMAKGQKRTHREAGKLKQTRRKTAAQPASGLSVISRARLACGSAKVSFR